MHSTGGLPVEGTSTAGGESGQVLISLLMMLALFLLAIVGFSVDLTNLWFHRQAAQSAADSSCQAGALDMYAVADGLSLPSMGFTPGTSGDCSASPSTTICYYAKTNGFAGAGLSANAVSSSVGWIFPATVPGATAPPGSVTSYPFLKVTVKENVKTHFLYTLQGTRYQTVAASCTCGLVEKAAAPPMVVLNPTISGAFTYGGGASFNIVGGPQRSVLVNSTSATAIVCVPSGLINTSLGGPSGTGSNVATVGGPTQSPSCSGGGFNGGTTGNWRGNALPVADPYGTVPAPSRPTLSTTASTPHVVAYGSDGCPDHSPTNYVSTIPHSGCLEFEPGYYPSGIAGSLNANDVAIFKPGIYYMNGNLTVGGSDEIRMATPCKPSCSAYSTIAWQQTDGVMFYFLTGSLNIAGGTGSLPSSRVDPVASTALTCDGSVPTGSLGMPSANNGNILVAQCATNGTYWDASGDTTDSRGNPGSRGLLVFQAHSNTMKAQFGGSGSLSFSGSLYFHSTGYADVLSVSGGASSGTYILGEIVADQVNLSGSGAINLALNPIPSTDMLKVGMLQ